MCVFVIRVFAKLHIYFYRYIQLYRNVYNIEKYYIELCRRGQGQVCSLDRFDSRNSPCSLAALFASRSPGQEIRKKRPSFFSRIIPKHRRRRYVVPFFKHAFFLIHAVSPLFFFSLPHFRVLFPRISTRVQQNSEKFWFLHLFLAIFFIFFYSSFQTRSFSCAFYPFSPAFYTVGWTNIASFVCPLRVCAVLPSQSRRPEIGRRVTCASL